MKLYPLSFPRLQFLETGQFIIRFATDFQSLNLDPSADVDFKDLYDSLLAQSPVYDAALMQVRAKAESELLMTQDTIRDRKVRTLRRALNIFEYSDDLVEQTAYKTLKLVFITYKNIETANFEAESLGLDNLVAELRNARHADAVQTLGLNSHINNLETANATFKNTFNTRSTTTITTTVYNAKMLRKNMLETYKNIAEYILVMAKRRNTPFYIDTLTVINNGRKYFSDIIARRSATNNDKEK